MIYVENARIGSEKSEVTFDVTVSDTLLEELIETAAVAGITIESAFEDILNHFIPE